MTAWKVEVENIFKTTVQNSHDVDAGSFTQIELVNKRTFKRLFAKNIWVIRTSQNRDESHQRIECDTLRVLFG